MSIAWTDHQDAIDWNELETLYRLASLGNKGAGHLRTVFTHSRIKCFVQENGPLVAAGQVLSDGAYLCHLNEV